jgi:hypothetical protein
MMKKRYEAPEGKLILFRSEEILANSDDIASAKDFTEEEEDLLDA